MSSIVAIKDNDKIIIAYDSAQLSLNGERDDSMVVEKVFKHPKYDIIFGVTGYAGYVPVLRNIKVIQKRSETETLINYVTTKIVRAIKKEAANQGLTKKFRTSTIMVIVENRMFVVNNDFLVTEHSNSCILGCGYGKYVLKTISYLNPDMTGRDKVLLTMRVISDMNVNVYPPFYIMDSISCRVQSFDK